MGGIMNKFYGIILCFCLCLGIDAVGNNKLLSKPSTDITEDYIQESFKAIQAIFGGWCNNGKKYFAFTYYGGKVGFIIRFKHNLPEELTEQEKVKFVAYTMPGEKELIYEYISGYVPQEHTVAYQHNTIHQNSQETFLPYESKNPNGQTISVETCAQMIKEKRVVFLTGAGISASAGIYTISSLWDALHRDFSLLVDCAVKDVLNNPHIPESIILEFYRQARENKPTEAHYALTHLALKKNCQILTGNFDRLHERTGIRPYRVFYENIDTDFLAKDWQEIDILITIGSSFDFAGIINRYKHFNTEAKVLAINRQIPDYLDAGDYFLNADIQEALPIIQKNIINL